MLLHTFAPCLKLFLLNPFVDLRKISQQAGNLVRPVSAELVLSVFLYIYLLVLILRQFLLLNLDSGLQITKILIALHLCRIPIYLLKYKLISM